MRLYTGGRCARKRRGVLYSRAMWHSRKTIPWTVGILIVIALMVLCYAVALNAYWVGDDFNYVRPKGWDAVARFFDPVGRAQFRPLTWLTWAGDYALFGVEPLGWHLTRVLQHASNIVFAGLLIRDITGKPKLGLLAAALFAIHPAQPETVTWLGGQADASFAMPWLPALWLFVRWRQGASYALWFLAGVLGFVSMFGKEAAVTLPIMSLWIDLLFGRQWARWPGRRDAGWWRDPRLLLRLLRDHSLFIAASGCYIGLRLYLFLSGQGRLMYGEGQLGFLSNAVDVLTGYIMLALGAWWLPQEVHAWPYALKLVIILGAFVVLFLLVRWLGRVALFAVGWCAITLSLTLQAVASRWFYLPALGVGLLVACVWARLHEDSISRSRQGMDNSSALRTSPIVTRLLAFSLLLASVVSWSALTTAHNELWRQSGEVARDILAQVRALHPNPPRPATFYIGNPPITYKGVLLFNTGIDSAMHHIYLDWTNIEAYSLIEDISQVQKALSNDTYLGEHPIFLRYEDGRMVDYPSLQALVEADRK